jgi:hypothetical protein
MGPLARGARCIRASDAEKEMTAPTADKIHDIEFIVKAARAFLHPLLAGSESEVQSAVLADLTATYLAGIAPPLRPTMRAMFIQLIDDLVPQNEREIFGEAGHPSRRREGLSDGCPHWPGCGCGTQSGPHTCEWEPSRHARKVKLG